MRAHAGRFRTMKGMPPHVPSPQPASFVPDSPAGLTALPPFDPFRLPAVHAYPDELRLDAAIMELAQLAEEEADLWLQSPSLMPAYVADEFARLTERRRGAVAAVRREALCEARRSLGLVDDPGPEAVDEAARAAADAVRRAFERDPETDRETIEAMAHDAAVRAALRARAD